MMKHLLLTTLLASLCLGTILRAQDQHFTQFYAAPITFNPALTGAFNGSYRLGIIYRDQWRQVLDNPNVSYAASVDLRFAMRSRRRRMLDAVGAGVVFYSDKFSGIGFSTNQISVSGAYHKALSKDGDQFLTLGAQYGIAQRNVNYENLIFDDQFNGTDGYTGPSAEPLPENNFTYGDFSVGLNYTIAPPRRTALYTGIALHHVLEPQVSFYYNPREEDPDKNGNNILLRKLTAHFTLQIPVSESVQVSPRALFYWQGPHMALNAGASTRFLVNDRTGVALHLGGWVRPVSDQKSTFATDAVIVMTGLEINNFLVGFSYDANIRDFTTAGNRRNAFEISIAYLGNYDNETVLCPKF